MILVTAEVNNINKDVRDYESIYQFLAKQELYYQVIKNNRIYILVEDTEDYFRLCMDLLIAFNHEQLVAKLYISHSNENINLAKLNVETSTYQVFKRNELLRNACKKNRNFNLNDHFVIRAHHQMLDSILYSLSVMCLKYERNFGIIYDKYYNHMTQKEIASKYDITQAAVSKKLKSSNYEMFKLIVGRL